MIICKRAWWPIYHAVKKSRRCIAMQTGWPRGQPTNHSTTKQSVPALIITSRACCWNEERALKNPLKPLDLQTNSPDFWHQQKPKGFLDLYSTQNVDWILINNCWQRHHCCSSSSWISVWNFEETRSWGGGWKINHAEWCNYRLSALLARFLRVSKTAWKMVKFCSLTSIKIPKAQS